MNLNRIPECMRKDIIDLQQYHELTQRMKNNDRYHYWESHRLSNLAFKTLPFRMEINNRLSENEKVIFCNRYILKYPIIDIVQQTGYSKRMIQYKLNDIIIKLEEGNSFFEYIKKHKMQQHFINEYKNNTPKVAHCTTKKVQ